MYSRVDRHTPLRLSPEISGCCDQTSAESDKLPLLHEAAFHTTRFVFLLAKRLPERMNDLEGRATGSRTADRLQGLALHFAQCKTSQRHPAMAQRPFITCHVLDTISGKPGAGIDVKLKLISPAHATTAHWASKTNDDGRVPAWTSTLDINEVVAKVKSELSEGEQMVWSLTFDTETYFGKGKTFWPEVELRFAAKKEEEHYHVPLLLGPWSYTTYRGS